MRALPRAAAPIIAPPPSPSPLPLPLPSPPPPGPRRRRAPLLTPYTPLVVPDGSLLGARMAKARAGSVTGATTKAGVRRTLQRITDESCSACPDVRELMLLDSPDRTRGERVASDFGSPPPEPLLVSAPVSLQDEATTAASIYSDGRLPPGGLSHLGAPSAWEPTGALVSPITRPARPRSASRRVLAEGDEQGFGDEDGLGVHGRPLAPKVRPRGIAAGPETGLKITADLRERLLTPV